SFPDKLLEALDIPPSGEGVSSLLEAGILERSNLDKLIFRKEFMREAVYEMQLNEVLEELHKRIFDAWLAAFDDKDDYSLEKGYHAEKTGNIAAAREYYLLAGRQAQAVFSNIEAVELYYRVIRLDPQNTENTAVRLNIAEIYDLIGQWDNAYEELVKGVGFAILSDMEHELHRFFALGGQVLLQQSRISQAKALLLKAVRDPRAQGINPARIKARIDLARVHLLEGAYSDAMNRLFEAREMSEESEYIEGQGLSSYYLGRLNSVRNKKKEAAVYYTKARELFTKLNKPRLIANPLYDLGLLHRNEGKLDTAREYLEKALSLYVQIGYKSGISAALLNIGLIYDQQGEFSQAEEFFHRALNIAREIGEDLAVAYARFCLGAGSYKEGNLEKSLDYLTDAHRLITDLGAETYRGYTLSYLSSLTVRMGRQEQAVEYIQSLYDLISSTGEDPEHGRLYLALGSLVRDGMPENPDLRATVTRIADSEGIDPPDSVHFYQQAVKISKAAHYVNTLIPALLRLGEQLIRHKRDSAGMKYIRSAQVFAAASGWKNMQSRLEQQYGLPESES
ncbi:MAG: tetratricopeptide repeat protein, partial [Spirochaetaceae bacterium]|nr:tetratricopeptide repeat protein [Spirochaetaceae bacterium]